MVGKYIKFFNTQILSEDTKPLFSIFYHLTPLRNSLTTLTMVII